MSKEKWLVEYACNHFEEHDLVGIIETDNIAKALAHLQLDHKYDYEEDEVSFRIHRLDTLTIPESQFNEIPEPVIKIANVNRGNPKEDADFLEYLAKNKVDFTCRSWDCSVRSASADVLKARKVLKSLTKSQLEALGKVVDLGVLNV